MKTINLIIQECLKVLFIFLLTFIWIRYFIKKLWLAIILSAFFSALIYFVIRFFVQKKHNKTSLKLKEKESAENMYFSLACQENPMTFFAKLASKKHTNIKKHKNYITIIHEEEKVSTLLYFDRSFSGMDIPRFMDIYQSIKKENASKIIICCKSIVDKQLSTFCSNLKEKILIFDEYTAYEKLYKYYNCFPEITQTFSKNKKMIFKDLVAHSFNKKRTKGYLFSALILILSGIFVKMSIYYCVIASLLVVSAIISQFNPYYNIKTDPEVL